MSATAITVEHLPVELAHRESSGLRVRLLWTKALDRLTVAVDEVGGTAFELAVGPARALDVFNHPYAYAAARGVAFESPTRGEAPEEEGT
jgi:hypothetical protein